MNKVIFILLLLIIQTEADSIKNELVDDNEVDVIPSNFTAPSGLELIRTKRVVPSSSAGQGFCGVNKALLSIANILMMAGFSSIRSLNDCLVNIHTKMRRHRARNIEHHWPLVIDPVTNVSFFTKHFNQSRLTLH